MFYLDVWEGQVADWVPVWGGEHIALWPIFNVADASIFAGVALILVFQKRFFGKTGGEKDPAKAESPKGSLAVEAVLEQSDTEEQTASKG